MKSYQQVVNEVNEVSDINEAISDKIEFRKDSSKVVDSAKGKYGKPIAFFSIRQNPAGWNVYQLTKFDEQWVKSQGFDAKDIFRIVSDDGNTNLVKVNLGRALVYFTDQDHLEATDELKFERRGEKAVKFIIEEGMGKHFGIK